MQRTSYRDYLSRHWNRSWSFLACFIKHSPSCLDKMICWAGHLCSNTNAVGTAQQCHETFLYQMKKKSSSCYVDIALGHIAFSNKTMINCAFSEHLLYCLIVDAFICKYSLITTSPLDTGQTGLRGSGLPGLEPLYAVAINISHFKVPEAHKAKITRDTK